MPEPALYRLVWMPAAVVDLELIAAELGRHGVEHGAPVLSRIEERAASLFRFPLRGRILREVSRFGLRSWREMVVEPYRLIYRVAERQVQVFAVLDGRRDLDEIVLERVLRHLYPD